MNSVVINIKTEPKVKNQAKKIASDLGLTLSGVINAYLKQFVREKKVYFSLDESKPTPLLLSAIKEAKKDREEGKVYSFDDPQKAIDFLDK